MKKILAFGFATLISLTAFADFNGTWQGQGYYTDGGGFAEVCPSMKLVLSQTPTTFTVNSGTFECQSFKMIWKPFSLAIRNGELFDRKGATVGNINETLILAKKVDSRTQWTETYQTELTASGLKYKQINTDNSGNVVYIIEGHLKK